jgi:hypothetical protein
MELDNILNFLGGMSDEMRCKCFVHDGGELAANGD